ncbi:MAG TPA: twin-arginine translocase TatA/TatE family subunit [Pyrinomonadaceae bacterium]|nr:twin-arginine translocase TatA/TatE family subunit [Pyrinomonadaceae bacterium]
MMNIMLLIGMPGGWEWVVILVVILLLFGGSRLPQLAKSIGQSKRAFREGLDADDEEARLEEARRRERLNAAETRDNARVAADEYVKDNKR